MEESNREELKLTRLPLQSATRKGPLTAMRGRHCLMHGSH